MGKRGETLGVLLTLIQRFYYPWKSDPRVVDLALLDLASALGVRRTSDQRVSWPNVPMYRWSILSVPWNSLWIHWTTYLLLGYLCDISFSLLHRTTLMMIAVCALTTGEQVIDSQGFNTNYWWRWIDLAVVMAFCVLCFITAYPISFQLYFGSFFLCHFFRILFVLFYYIILIFLRFIALKLIHHEPAPAVVVNTKAKKGDAKEKAAETEKSDTVVDMARTEAENPLAIRGCHMVFKHLSYFVCTLEVFSSFHSFHFFLLPCIVSLIIRYMQKRRRIVLEKPQRPIL